MRKRTHQKLNSRMFLENKQNRRQIHLSNKEHIIEISFLRQMFQIMHKMPGISQLKSRIILQLFFHTHTINHFILSNSIQILQILAYISSNYNKEPKIEYSYSNSNRSISNISQRISHLKQNIDNKYPRTSHHRIKPHPPLKISISELIEEIIHLMLLLIHIQLRLTQNHDNQITKYVNEQ